MEDNDDIELDELESITCPNPKCHKKIGRPVLLSNMSATLMEQYYACPHCFVKLDMISPRPQDGREEMVNKEEDFPVKPQDEEEKDPSRCAGYFGYLASFPKDKPIPKECLVCPKTLDCVMKKSGS